MCIRDRSSPEILNPLPSNTYPIRSRRGSALDLAEMPEPLPEEDQFHWARVSGMQRDRRKCLECRELLILTSCSLSQSPSHASGRAGNARDMTVHAPDGHRAQCVLEPQFVRDVGPDKRSFKTTVQKAVDRPLPSIFTGRHRSNHRQKDTGGPYSRGAVNTDWRESSRDSVRSPILWFRVRGGYICRGLLLNSGIRLRR
ncbi:hypothetical protein T4E_2079 [Trichinella pseudospiralis]|uniref:Uncharacterized protein n=1 Tax=Trichinella pseudospiralis TaxID=6337 RepID=A0A0V0XKQ5_TRIPS|nr:hypothetical protein T4E_2079 [Trichinella pseudospiralis]